MKDMKARRRLSHSRIFPTSSFGLLLILILQATTRAELLYNKVGNTITIIGSNPKASGNLVIPTIIENLPVTSIGPRAFYNCSGLTNITIPDGVVSIGEGAIAACYSLTTAAIPFGIKSISPETFSDCFRLTSITIPESVMSIESGAFHNCTGLTGVRIPSTVTNIGNYAFRFCAGLTSATIPTNVTSLGYGAFYWCRGLTNVTLSAGIASISTETFLGCTNLTSITIPDSVRYINHGAFRGCTGLTALSLGNSVTSIAGYAFYDCDGLASLIIPKSVASLRSDSFALCSGLMSVYFMGNAPSLDGTPFRGSNPMVYFNSGTEGWQSTFGGRPTSMFLPFTTIESSTTAAGAIGQRFSCSTLTGSLAPLFTATGLPQGLSINTTTGLISGIPTTVGTYTVTLFASSATGTEIQTLTLTIRPAWRLLLYDLGPNLLALTTSSWGEAPYVVEYTEDFKLWTPLATLLYPDAEYLSNLDPQASSRPFRFYRLKKP